MDVRTGGWTDTHRIMDPFVCRHLCTAASGSSEELEREVVGSILMFRIIQGMRIDISEAVSSTFDFLEKVLHLDSENRVIPDTWKGLYKATETPQLEEFKGLIVVQHVLASISLLDDATLREIKSSIESQNFESLRLPPAVSFALGTTELILKHYLDDSSDTSDDHASDATTSQMSDEASTKVRDLLKHLIVNNKSLESVFDFEMVKVTMLRGASRALGNCTNDRPSELCVVATPPHPLSTGLYKIPESDKPGRSSPRSTILLFNIHIR
jgi:hypothetical protein